MQAACKIFFASTPPTPLALFVYANCLRLLRRRRPSSSPAAPLRAQTATATAPDPGSPSATRLDTVTVVGSLDEARQRIVPEHRGHGLQRRPRPDRGPVPGRQHPPVQAPPALPRREPGRRGRRLPPHPRRARERPVPDQRRPHPRGDHRLRQRVRHPVRRPRGPDHRRAPSQYGLRTTAIVDIHTKSGALAPGGDAQVYGGSHETVNPSFEYGGSRGKWDYYLSGSYLQSTLGIENPGEHALRDPRRHRPIPGLPPGLPHPGRHEPPELPRRRVVQPLRDPERGGRPRRGGRRERNPWPGLPAAFDQSGLRNTQDEQNNYEVVAYQKTVDDLDLPARPLQPLQRRELRPGHERQPLRHGVSGSLDRSLMSQGLQFDGSYRLTDAPHPPRRADARRPGLPAEEPHLRLPGRTGPGRAPAAAPTGVPIRSYDTRVPLRLLSPGRMEGDPRPHGELRRPVRPLPEQRGPPEPGEPPGERHL